MWLLKSADGKEVLRVNLLDPIELYNKEGKLLSRKAIFKLAFSGCKESLVYKKKTKTKWIRVPVYVNNCFVGEDTKVSTKKTLEPYLLSPES